MKNETRLSQAKAGYEYKENDKIVGLYHGVSFSGKVLNSRRHTIRHDQTEIIVKLDNPIVVYGTKRERILLSILDNSEVI